MPGQTTQASRSPEARDGDAVTSAVDRSAPGPARPTLALGWLGDFAWVDGRIEVLKTGHLASLDHFFFAEVASWCVWLLVLGVAVVAARLTFRRPIAVWFAPERPRPWYLLGGAALWAGLRTARSPAEADAAIYFDDVTTADPAIPAVARRFNFGCTDVSKSHVARVFEEVFGYPLAVDPTTTSGPIVEKSEINGVHDGRIVQAPAVPRPGYVYQRLIDTADGSGFSYDLRTPCVAGRPVVVWVKEKPADERFAIHNRVARLRDPAEIYSPDELAAIARFTTRMGLDWGGLDILRDREDGRIYVVDVNKTDLGPVIALSWGDKIRSMNRLARALRAMVSSSP